MSGTKCVKCASDRYSESGAMECIKCPKNKISRAGSISLDDCTPLGNVLISKQANNYFEI